MGGESDIFWENRGFGVYMEYVRRDFKLVLILLMLEMDRDYCYSELEKLEEVYLKKLEVNIIEGMKFIENYKVIVKKEMVFIFIQDFIQVFRDQGVSVMRREIIVEEKYMILRILIFIGNVLFD